MYDVGYGKNSLCEV